MNVDDWQDILDKFDEESEEIKVIVDELEIEKYNECIEIENKCLDFENEKNNEVV